ncbi:MAG TPA: hypothetical protein VK585_17740 [Jiangellaceae bacterium]|nr:hypothetical protein [Jiangellaceae bacterium]
MAPAAIAPVVDEFLAGLTRRRRTVYLDTDELGLGVDPLHGSVRAHRSNGFEAFGYRQ